MEIRVLNYFLAVAHEENITKAAQLLHITQPTLSRQLAQLEEETGTVLFTRGAKKITLTAEGLLLKRRAEEIIELMHKTEQELAQPKGSIEGTVSIGCGDFKAMQLLPELFKQFREAHPRVQFDVYTATADHIKTRMDRGLTDAGLLLEPIEIEKYDFIRLHLQEKWVVLLHGSDPLTGKTCIAPQDLAERPLILPHRMQMQNELSSWFGEYYKTLHVVMHTNLTSAAAVMVSQGIGCAVAVEGSNVLYDQTKITSRPLDPNLPASTVLAWKRNQPFSPAAEAFIGAAKTFFANRSAQSK